MDQEQNQQQQRSSRLNTYLNARSSLRNLRFLIKGARAVAPLFANPFAVAFILAFIAIIFFTYDITLAGPGSIPTPTQDTGGNTAPNLPPGGQPNVPAPPVASSELRQKLNELGVRFMPSIDDTHLQWAWEILWQAKSYAPRFFTLLGNVTVDTHADTSERKGNIIYFSTIPGSFYMDGNETQFKVLLIHELGHVIRGSGALYDGPLQEAVNKDRGHLTEYGENPCYGTLGIDEDFSETITYYINQSAKEENLGCGVKSTDGRNPLFSGKYPYHLQYIKSVLGP